MRLMAAPHAHFAGYMGSLVLPSGKVATMNYNMMQVGRHTVITHACMHACLLVCLCPSTHAARRLVLRPGKRPGNACARPPTPATPFTTQVIEPWSGEALAEAPSLPEPVKDMAWEVRRLVTPSNSICMQVGECLITRAMQPPCTACMQLCAPCMRPPAPSAARCCRLPHPTPAPAPLPPPVPTYGTSSDAARRTADPRQAAALRVHGLWRWIRRRGCAAAPRPAACCLPVTRWCSAVNVSSRFSTHP